MLTHKVDNNAEHLKKIEIMLPDGMRTKEAIMEHFGVSTICEFVSMCLDKMLILVASDGFSFCSLFIIRAQSFFNVDILLIAKLRLDRK